MNILLVYPKYPDTFWGFKHALKFVSKKAAFPPLGLLTVASLLPKEWNKKLIDVNVNELKDIHIEWADMVLISAMIVQKKSTMNIVKRCKTFGKKVVAGGPFFTTNHEKLEGIDHFILNEAEVTLPMFLNDLKKGKLKKVYSSDIKPDITKTPLPSWSLINFKDYATMAVQYSRGCPFNCDFCDIIIMNGRIPRSKTPVQMVDEFESLYRAGWKGSIFIVDDNFIGDKPKVKNMLSHIISWQKKHKYPFRLLTEASVNLAEDKELMRMMSAANFSTVFLGLETPSTEGLMECSKIQNTTKNLEEAVKTIHQHGLQVQGGFIVGFDSDTESIFEAQIRFIQKIGVVTAMVGMLNALPQTRLWHRLNAEGRLLKDSTGENTDGSLNFEPLMSKEKLIAGYKKILARIYSPKNYYKRINTFIKSYKPTVKTRITRRDLAAFVRSIWKIGILSKARLFYWKLLLRTSLTKRKAIPVAVELAIYHQHFEKITKRILHTPIS